MTEFDDYKELFAEQGDLDIPANFALSATIKATPKVNVSFDYQRILYEGVNSISNPGPVLFLLRLLMQARTHHAGSPACIGRGQWHGLRLGGHRYLSTGGGIYDNSHWTFRAGVAYNTSR